MGGLAPLYACLLGGLVIGFLFFDFGLVPLAIGIIGLAISGAAIHSAERPRKKR